MTKAMKYENYQVRLVYNLYEREVYVDGKLSPAFFIIQEMAVYNILDYCCVNAIDKAKTNLEQNIYPDNHIEYIEYTCKPQPILELRTTTDVETGLL